MSFCKSEEFNQSYKEGIIEVSIERGTYDQYFKAIEYRYDEKNDRDRMEVVVPQELWLFVTWYGSIGGHKLTKSLSGKRLN